MILIWIGCDYDCDASLLVLDSREHRVTLNFDCLSLTHYHHHHHFGHCHHPAIRTCDAIHVVWQLKTEIIALIVLFMQKIKKRDNLQNRIYLRRKRSAISRISSSRSCCCCIWRSFFSISAILSALSVQMKNMRILRKWIESEIYINASLDKKKLLTLFV